VESRKEHIPFRRFLPEDFGSEPQGKFQDADAACARGQKMSQFMRKNQNPQQHDK